MSVRVRLLTATALVALVALVGADVATYASLRSYLYGQIDGNLQLSSGAVQRSIGGGAGAPPPSVGLPPQHCPTFDGAPVATGGLNPGTVIELRDSAGTTIYRCDLAQLGSSRRNLPVLPSHVSGFTATAASAGEPVIYFDAASTSGGAGFRVRAVELRGGPDARGVLVVAAPLTSTADILGDLLTLELVVTGGALVVALVLGWWLVRASLKPLRDIEATADAITAGQLTERVPGDQARTEVGRVARAFNVMLERIQLAFMERDRKEEALHASEGRMRRFVADASHELRTPLAAVRAYADLFDRGASDRPDDLRRLVGGIQRESLRMSDLVEDLLLLARLDEGRPLRMEAVDLAAVAAESVATARELGAEWPVTLEAQPGVEVRGDPLRLRQVLDNLLSNVREHCPPGTTTRVHVGAESAAAVLTVSDDGPGFDVEASQLFERFFRAEASRSRRHGGAGLGLAIVAAIVDAHGGTVAAGRSPSGGACFVVRLPGAATHAVRSAASGPVPAATGRTTPSPGQRLQE